MGLAKVNNGGMAEWSKAAAILAVSGETHSRVRIPSSSANMYETPSRAGSQEISQSPGTCWRAPRARSGASRN